MDVPSHELQNYFTRLEDLLRRVPLEPLTQIVGLLLEAYRERRTVFIAGNGGSAATASHMACDLTKSTTVGDRARMRVISLTDNLALLTAWANDTSYDRVFAEQLLNLGQPGDILVAISASGNSPNILEAAATAHRMGMRTVALTGFDGGQLIRMADVAVLAPSFEYGPVEDVHLVIDHALTTALSAAIRTERSVVISHEPDAENAGPDAKEPTRRPDRLVPASSTEPPTGYSRLD